MLGAQRQLGVRPQFAPHLPPLPGNFIHFTKIDENACERVTGGERDLERSYVDAYTNGVAAQLQAVETGIVDKTFMNGHSSFAVAAPTPGGATTSHGASFAVPPGSTTSAGFSSSGAPPGFSFGGAPTEFSEHMPLAFAASSEVRYDPNTGQPVRAAPASAFCSQCGAKGVGGNFCTTCGSALF